MSTAPAKPKKATSKAIAVKPDQETWTRAQINALRTAGIDAPQRELDLLYYVMQRTGLDPFVGQLYMKQYDGRWTIQTSIDGLRLIARRAVDQAGETLAYEPPLWAGDQNTWEDLWTAPEHPDAARVVVLRNGHRFPGTALYREYVQFTDDNRVNRTWLKRPAGQLAKCAEALALRMAFPLEMSGVYTDDEMAQATNPDTVPGTVVTPTESSELDDLLGEDE